MAAQSMWEMTLSRLDKIMSMLELNRRHVKILT